MPHKAALLNTRIEPEIKKEAEKILQKIGLSSAEAVRLFYTHVCLHGGLPFELKLPKKKKPSSKRSEKK